MTRPRRLAVLAAIVAIALPACSSQDAEVNDVVEAMEDAGLSQSEADCVGDGFEAADFTQDDLNEIAEAETPEDYPGDTGDQIREILETCANESSSSTTESDSTTSTTGG
jgi:hypothetical protein